MLLNNLGLMEQRDEGLVSRLDQHELQGVSIESHALKGRNDGIKSRTACNYSAMRGEPRLREYETRRMFLLFPIPFMLLSWKMAFSR